MVEAREEDYFRGKSAVVTGGSSGIGLALAQAMADIRLRRRDGRDHIQLASALRWVHASDVDWPLSFLRVCELLQLDPAWVRQTVNRWLGRAASSSSS